MVEIWERCIHHMSQTRLRCPVCGMVSWQSSLNQEHPFEILVQQRIPGQGGKGRCWQWQRNVDPEGIGTRAMKLMLAKKLRSIASRLEREAKSLTSTSVEKSVSEMSALISLLTQSVERFESQSTVMSAV